MSAGRLFTAATRHNIQLHAEDFFPNVTLIGLKNISFYSNFLEFNTSMRNDRFPFLPISQQRTHLVYYSLLQLLNLIT